MIHIKSLSKKFGEKVVIEDLTIHIKQGEFYCLLGANGAGKTTTLKILSGLMKPTEGDIYINGRSLSKDGESVKKILGLIPDSPFLYETLTPLEFLEFVRDVFNVERETALNIRNEYFTLFKLDEFLNTPIKNLSHGTRQKIVYISNFIHSPLVYLIDEPLVGLDPYSIHLVKKMLKEKTTHGAAILMCTHILSIAEELADRIGILHQGKLIMEDCPYNLKEKLGAVSLEDAFLKLTS